MILSQNEHWDCRRFTFLNVCFSPKGAPLWASFCVERNDYSMRDFAKDFYKDAAPHKMYIGEVIDIIR